MADSLVSYCSLLRTKQTDNFPLYWTSCVTKLQEKKTGNTFFFKVHLSSTLPHFAFRFILSHFGADQITRRGQEKESYAYRVHYPVSHGPIPCTYPQPILLLERDTKKTIEQVNKEQDVLSLSPIFSLARCFFFKPLLYFNCLVWWKQIDSLSSFAASGSVGRNPPESGLHEWWFFLYFQTLEWTIKPSNK